MAKLLEPGQKPHRLRVMFRCDVCKAACPVRFVEHARRSLGKDKWDYERIIRFYKPENAPAAWMPYDVGAFGWERGRLGGLMQKCGACGAAEYSARGKHQLHGKEMVVRLSPDHKCDARCLNAKGHICECSCGGENHGAGFLADYIDKVAASDALKAGA